MKKYIQLDEKHRAQIFQWSKNSHTVMIQEKFNGVYHNWDMEPVELADWDSVTEYIYYQAIPEAESNTGDWYEFLEGVWGDYENEL